MFSSRLQSATAIPIGKARTASLLLANRFEADVVRREGVVNGVFGPEQALGRRYGASANVVRQALRVLEARRIGSMRRGAGGGLVIRVPTVHETAHMIALYLDAIDADPGDVANARSLLSQQLSDRDAATRDAATDLLDAIEQAIEAPSLLRQEDPGNRALIIARRIIDTARRKDASGNARLGTIDELEMQHSSGRPVLVQALRILEDLEMVAVQRGRHGGFSLRRPTPGAIVRAVYPHFMLRGMAPSAVEDLIWSINAINAINATRHGPVRALIPIRTAIQSLPTHRFASDAFAYQVRIWRVLADFHANDVLHVLVRTLYYFQVRSGTSAPPPIDAATMRALHRLTADLVDRICAGDTAAVTELMAECEARTRDTDPAAERVPPP